jgi:chromosome segregation ATPase
MRLMAIDIGKAEKQLSVIAAQLAARKEEVARLRGEEKQLLGRLRELGCGSVEEAEKEIERLGQSVAADETELAALLDKLAKEWAWD